MKKVQPLCQDMPNQPLLMDEHRAKDYLGVSLSFLRKARSEGAPRDRTQGPSFVKIGGRVYYRVVDLNTWVAELETRRVS